jgi:phosphoenolpyruvate synthase/pyruvate phosphate dikinase
MTQTVNILTHTYTHTHIHIYTHAHRGGMTSHAAVVARGWGKPCVAGCGAVSVDVEKKVHTFGVCVSV